MRMLPVILALFALVPVPASGASSRTGRRSAYGLSATSRSATGQRSGTRWRRPGPRATGSTGWSKKRRLPGPVPFALILDNLYQQEWDLSTTPHRLRVWGGDFRLRVITGDTMADVRRVVWSWLEGEVRKIFVDGLEIPF